MLSLAAYTSSAALTNSPATPVVAGARGESPSEDDPSLAVGYECESVEMAYSRRLKQFPERLQAAYYRPSIERAQLDYHDANVKRSMFGSDNEDDPPSPVPSPILSHVRISVRTDDDGVSHRNKCFSGTLALVSTT